MSEQAQAAAPATEAAAPAAAHPAHHTNYVKIWGILLVLLAISIAGPTLGIRWLTLMTAFGIAIVKAYLVARNFMHLNIEKRFVVYLLVGVLGLMGLFFIAVAPDVMKHDGAGWTNEAAKAEVARALAAEKAKAGEESAEHH